MSEHFNKLTPAQAERLALLLEELGEAQHAIGKILRHGYASSDPTSTVAPSNRKTLERELGDVTAAINIMCELGDLSASVIDDARGRKRGSVGNWLHHHDEYDLRYTGGKAP